MSAPLDLTAETPLSLAAAARRLPPLRGGRPVHPATVLRWILDGIRGPGGGRVRLEGVRVGGRWVTTVEALARFQAELSAIPGDAGPTPRTPGQRRRASERAAAELERIGI